MRSKLIAMNFHIGERFKKIRTEVYNLTQEEFAKKINEYSKSKGFKSNINQSYISSIEDDDKLNFKKNMIIIINFLYDTEKINPAWILLENNNTQQMRNKYLVSERKLTDIYENILKKQEEISDQINDIFIIINNLQ